MRKPLALVVSAVLTLAACSSGGGGGDLSSEEKKFVDAAMDNFDPDEAAPLTRDDAECIAESFVKAIGIDRLRELGITPASFSDDEESFPSGLSAGEANKVVDGFDDCVGLSDLFLQSMAEDQQLSDDAKDCLAKAFDDKTVRDIFVKLLVSGEDDLGNDPEFTSTMLKLFSACPEALNF